LLLMLLSLGTKSRASPPEPSTEAPLGRGSPLEPSTEAPLGRASPPPEDPKL
jgi:hypothetical protein